MFLYQLRLSIRPSECCGTREEAHGHNGNANRRDGNNVRTCALFSVGLTTHVPAAINTHGRVQRHQGRPSASSQRQHTSPVTKRIVKTAAHITGTTDLSTPAGVALYATAASRLRAPKLEALPAFSHVPLPHEQL